MLEARHLVGKRDPVLGWLYALVVALLVGAVIVCSIPFVMQARSQSELNGIVSRAQAKSEAMSTADKAVELAAARSYNEGLVRAGRQQFTGGSDPVYESELAHQSVMAVVKIPEINLSVPVFHGTGDESLKSGAGHLYGSSLPVGGPSTHAVIAAHNGNPADRLFTNIDQLKMGDKFEVVVDGESLWYAVDRRVVVLPEDVSDHVRIEKGVDRVSLLTCTPYGVNTHRLIVSGVRTTAPAADEKLPSRWSLDPLFPVGASIAAVAIVLAGIVLWFIRGRRGRHSIGGK